MQASCIISAQTNSTSKEYILYVASYYSNLIGESNLRDTLKVWYKDSMAIQEVRKINAVTKGGITIVNNPIVKYRFIDLRSNSYYDYLSLYDTSQMIKKGSLDTFFKGGGWAFFASNNISIAGGVQFLADTTISGVLYKKAKLYSSKETIEKGYQIGYFQCDIKDMMFSLEKKLSSSQQCAMTKIYTFVTGNPTPVASLQVNFVSNELPPEIRKIFDVWEKNIR
jgi:hypothetical protein